MFETLCRIHFRRSKWPKLAAAGWKRHRVLCTASPLSWTSRQVKVKVKVKGHSTAAPVHRTWWSQAVASARQGLRVRARPRTTTSPYTDRPRHLSPATIITCIIIITSSSSSSSSSTWLGVLASWRQTRPSRWRVIVNPLTPTVYCHIGTAVKHPVPFRVKPSFVIFDIRALWRSGCQKLHNDGLTRSGTGCLYIVVPIWQQWASKGLTDVNSMVL